MNRFCGHAVLVGEVKVGKATITEEGQAPEEKVAILASGEDGYQSGGLIMSYGAAWRLTKRVLKLLAGSGDGMAEDAGRMLCRKDKT